VSGAIEGTPFGRYRLTDMLGRGGMGEVWRAYDPVMDRYVALKVLPQDYADNHTSQERFRREARKAAGLDEPHVVPIHDSGEIDGRLFVTMKLIKGRDLQDILEDGPLPPARAVTIIAQVASALHAAHQVNLVHRDVKPSNIFVEHDDFTYLIDFGIARVAGEAGLTSTSTTIGTWAYMAPERFRNGIADASSDIYALACVLYQALTGQPPFPADALEQIAVAHMMQPPPQPSELQPGLPAAMDQVIATGMAKDPQQRYHSTLELAAAAQHALTAAAVPTPPEDPPATVPGADTVAERATWRPTDTVLDYPDTRPPQPVVDVPLDSTMLATTTPHQPVSGTPQVRRSLLQRMSLRARIGVGVAVLAVIAAVVGFVTIGHQTPQQPSQVVLPFTGLNHPDGVAVDGAGNLYVADRGNSRVLKLAAGATTPVVLPFTGLSSSGGVAVDGAGDLYVTDYGNDRVLKLAAGATTPVVLPFTGLAWPEGVAVDGAGNLYVTNYANNQVLKLAAGTTTPVVLPFTGLDHPFDVAVDSAGNLYVADFDNNRVLKLAAGSTTQVEMPFTGLLYPRGVAVDRAGNLYVTDTKNNRVLTLAAGTSTQTVLPFTGLSAPVGVAVDGAGNLYVTDSDNNRVLKLPAG
jgi:serine/threonine-protein kinase